MKSFLEFLEFFKNVKKLLEKNGEKNCKTLGKKLTYVAVCNIYIRLEELQIENSNWKN